MEVWNWKDVQHVNDICVMAPTLQLAEKAEMLIKQENYQTVSYTHLTLPTIYSV